MVLSDKTAGSSTSLLPTPIHSLMYVFVTTKNKSTYANNFCDIITVIIVYIIYEVKVLEKLENFKTMVEK